MHHQPCPRWATLGLALLGGAALAQTPAQQKVSPPQAQAWLDIATYSGFGMPNLGGGGSAMAMLGGLLGNVTGLGGNRFGNTQAGLAGRWMDVTLSSRRQPQLGEALMSVPQTSGLAPTLKLVPPRDAPAAPQQPRGDEESVTSEHEKPKGKVSLYWGCGDTVRPGQPRVVDFANALPADLMQVFNGRRATQRGTHSAAGRPLWPSEADPRKIPDGTSLAGEMGFKAEGLPEGFRFTLPAAQDLMPPLELQQADAAGATQLHWTALPTARGYFAAVMGAAGKQNDEANLVLWTSSELPDSGFGLVDYQTNPAVDRWLKDKVLLPPSTTSCTVPSGIFTGGAGMLRLIAYGNELNLAHPPRPTDVRVPWEPEWAVKVRVKSVASAMLGMDMGGGRKPAAEAPEKKDKPSALDRLRGVLGR
jgi:hypothetical protein